MNVERAGFLIKKNGKIKVDAKKTTSILSNQLLVDLLLSWKQYFKGKLLDAGCGERPYGLIYDELVEKSVGCDIEGCIHDQSRIDVFSSVDALPFADNEFDTVLCTEVLEHVPNAWNGFSEIARVLKPGGYAIVTVPFLMPTHEAPHDYYRYTRFGLTYQLERNGFEVVDLIPRGGFGLMIMIYFNYAVNMVLKCRPITALNCLMQKLTYKIYKPLCIGSIKKGPRGISKVITMGYLAVARKK